MGFWGCFFLFFAPLFFVFHWHINNYFFFLSDLSYGVQINHLTMKIMSVSRNSWCLFRVDDLVVIINKIMISMSCRFEYFSILNNLNIFEAHILELNWKVLPLPQLIVFFPHHFSFILYTSYSDHSCFCVYSHF